MGLHCPGRDFFKAGEDIVIMDGQKAGVESCEGAVVVHQNLFLVLEAQKGIFEVLPQDIKVFYFGIGTVAEVPFFRQRHVGQSPQRVGPGADHGEILQRLAGVGPFSGRGGEILRIGCPFVNAVRAQGRVSFLRVLAAKKTEISSPSRFSARWGRCRCPLFR